MSTNQEKIEAQRMAIQSTDCAHLRHLIGPEELERILSPLQPIATAPRDGTFVLLFGPSGYGSTPFRCEVGRYVEKGWRTHANDWFTDGGAKPTHWMPLPEVPCE